MLHGPTAEASSQASIHQPASIGAHSFDLIHPHVTRVGADQLVSRENNFIWRLVVNNKDDTEALLLRKILQKNYE